MSTYFTADPHLGHANIILYANRPFVDRNRDLDERGRWISREIARQRANEMDETIIMNWNSIVRRPDDVFLLGDFAFCEDANIYLKRLNGRIHWIHGNHDKAAWAVSHKFASHSPLMEIKVNFPSGNRLVVLCHYAMRVWNKSHWGSYHLYGHSHGSLDDLQDSLSMDCGMDCNNLFPFSVEQIYAHMSTKTLRPIDHHRGK
jgi:calcineurin-like phosphoesterase family protein